MSITAYTLIQAKTADELETAVAAQIALSYQPYGFPFVVSDTFVQPMTQGAPVSQDPTSLQSAIDTAQTAADDAQADATAVTTDHNTLETAYRILEANFNLLLAKLDDDGGVTDVDYESTLEVTPLA